MPKKAILAIAAASVIAIPLISSAGPLSQSVKETKTGLVRHSKKIPQCAHVTSVDRGRVQTLNYGYSTVDAIYETDENNKLQSVTLYGAAGIKKRFATSSNELRNHRTHDDQSAQIPND